MDEPESDSVIPDDKLWLGGSLGIASVSVVQLVSVPMDIFLRVALYAFSAAIPLTAAGLLGLGHLNHQGRPAEKTLLGMALAGCLAAYVGVVALVSHIAWPAGITFAAISVAAFVVWFMVL